MRLSLSLSVYIYIYIHVYIYIYTHMCIIYIYIYIYIYTLWKCHPPPGFRGEEQALRYPSLYQAQPGRHLIYIHLSLYI